jgi:DNA-directed RNA polymerase subunit RPC12/RpoP
LAENQVEQQQMGQHVNILVKAAKYSPVTIPAGTDNRGSRLHPGRFLPGAAVPVQRLWHEARQLWGPDGVEEAIAVAYDLEGLGVHASCVAAGGWEALHHPGSADISLKLFSNYNVGRGAAAAGVSLKTVHDDSGEEEEQAEHLTEWADLLEVKAALRTLCLAAHLAVPWNFSFKAVEMFLRSTQYMNNTIKGRKKARILAAFVDHALQVNATNWREDKDFLDMAGLRGLWESWWTARRMTMKGEAIVRSGRRQQEADNSKNGNGNNGNSSGGNSSGGNSSGGNSSGGNCSGGNNSGGNSSGGNNSGGNSSGGKSSGGNSSGGNSSGGNSSVGNSSGSNSTDGNSSGGKNTGGNGIGGNSSGGNSNSDNNMRTQSNEMPAFKCFECAQEFEHEIHLQTHMRSHSAERSYHCIVCSESFTKRRILQSHMKIHSGEKTFKCPECPRLFSNLRNMRDHMKRNHSGEKSYRCEDCSVSFVRFCELKRHMKKHTGEKPHKCPVCSKSFIQNNNLQMHMRIHTGEKPFQCSECS